MRAHFLVDGFNLYHSVKAAERRLGGSPLRWLDQWRLCETLMRSVFGPGSTLAGVDYFSAFATHLEAFKPDVVRRHRAYVSALRSTGVRITMANFKRKDRIDSLDHFKVRLPLLRSWLRLPLRGVRLWYRSHEEKETDVAIACRLLEILYLGQCDAVVVVSGDTDIAPALRTARSLFPQVLVCVAFPYDRQNKVLAALASRTFRLTAQLYQSHQLPAVVAGPGGERITKPATW
jgi:hypothetical protein